MIPILFPYDAVSFSSHGIGDLTSCISCVAAQNANGEYEIQFEYPVDGAYVDQIKIHAIVVVKPNSYDNYQAFRIYAISKEIGGVITVHGQHISYDLADVPVNVYSAETCKNAMAGLKTNSAYKSYTNRFSFYTDVTATAQNEDKKFEVDKPVTVRAALLDGDDSIKGTFGGDLVFDNYTVSLLNMGGTDRGILIEYGVDLIDIKQEENNSEMYTSVYPYWKGGEDETVVYGSIRHASGNFERKRIYPLDVTEYFPNNEKAPSVDEINTTADKWMAANDIGKPRVNLSLSYAQLGKDVRLHDAVKVRFVKMGIETSAKVISYKYDVLQERCTNVEVGYAKPSLLFSLEDASRLKKGLIPPKRIANRSIGSGALGLGAVKNFHIGPGEVKTGNIEEGAVKEKQLDNDSVTVNKIQNGAVTSAKIPKDQILADHILKGQVAYEKLSTWLQGQIDEIVHIPTLTSDVAAIENLFTGNSWSDGVHAKYITVDYLWIKSEGTYAGASTSGQNLVTTNKLVSYVGDELLAFARENHLKYNGKQY